MGIAKANTIPVHSSVIADTYPIGIRGRIGAIDKGTGRLLAVTSPILVGAIAAVANGPGEIDGWRWTYYLLGIPVAVAAIAAFFLKEPQRGRWEKEDVLEESFTEDDPLPVSMDAAFSRLMQIKTIKTVVVGFSALGFGLFTAPVLENLWLEDEFGLESFERGAWGTTAGLAPVGDRRGTGCVAEVDKARDGLFGHACEAQVAEVELHVVGLEGEDGLEAASTEAPGVNT